jgi:CRP-like cAMP-binding protein
MLNILANKNINLTQKLEHVTGHNTREKLLSYLSERARLTGKSKFTIPLNRQELADFLAVERSAMSAELSRMQSDGILSYHKNEFELLR